ncbi:MAG: hypothetical protein H0V44_14815 [Planctomycetes bacterium]|nr:hypothetical protein [Planctomycetota bacterium]
MTPERDAAAALSDWCADSDASAHARARFAATLPVFIGHFPGHPLVPGVYQVAAVAETARRALGGASVVAIERAKWSAPALPDQDLAITARWRRDAGRLIVDGTVSGPNGACTHCRIIMQEHPHG